MSHQEEIEQFLFLDHTKLPRKLNAEEVEKFLDLCKRLNYLRGEALMPINSSGKTVAELIRMVDVAENDVAGPYAMEQNGSPLYYPEGIMIYKRPTQGPAS